tara:strand:- start:371 stop:592 length:222 start_codon:yes stop_codon:yes gene_type:complete
MNKKNTNRYGISYIRKDNHRDSFQGYSLYVRFYNATSQTNALAKFRKSRFFEYIPELGSCGDCSNIRGVWLDK